MDSYSTASIAFSCGNILNGEWMNHRTFLFSTAAGFFSLSLLSNQQTVMQQLFTCLLTFQADYDHQTICVTCDSSQQEVERHFDECSFEVGKRKDRARKWKWKKWNATTSKWKRVKTSFRRQTSAKKEGKKVLKFVLLRNMSTYTQAVLLNGWTHSLCILTHDLTSQTLSTHLQLGVRQVKAVDGLVSDDGS